MDEVIFASGSVPVAVAARVYGKDASWIRAGIISGWLPIGKATRNGKLITNLEEMNSKVRTNQLLHLSKVTMAGNGLCLAR